MKLVLFTVRIHARDIFIQASCTALLYSWKDNLKDMKFVMVAVAQGLYLLASVIKFSTQMIEQSNYMVRPIEQ